MNVRKASEVTKSQFAFKSIYMYDLHAKNMWTELEQFVVCYKQSESEGNVHFIWFGSAILSHRFLSAYSFDNMHQPKNTDLKSINI